MPRSTAIASRTPRFTPAEAASFGDGADPGDNQHGLGMPRPRIAAIGWCRVHEEIPPVAFHTGDRRAGVHVRPVSAQRVGDLGGDLRVHGGHQLG
jgi:hypothetical protein